MTEKEIEKEHSQEELKPDIHEEKSNEVHSENPSEPTPEPQPQTNGNNGNGEVTLRDVVEVLKKGFSSLSEKLDTVSTKLDAGFSEISGKLDTVSTKLDTGFSDISTKLDSIEGVLKGIKSSIGMLRGEISEWALLDTIVDYLKEHEGEKEFIIRKTPKTGKTGADWLLETRKRYYIIETKTYLDDKIFDKALGQIRKEAQKLSGDKEIWGIIAARFSGIQESGPIILKAGRREFLVFIFPVKR